MSIIASNTQPHLLRSDVDLLDVGRDSPLLRSLGSAIAVRLYELSGPGAPFFLFVVLLGFSVLRARGSVRARR